MIDDALQHHNREAGNTRYDTTGFHVRVADANDWVTVNAWGNGESWNIGFQDAACFLPVDPEGFFLGLVDDRPVSAVSLVNYSDQFAFWGHYLVAPEARGKGYGIGVCKVASRHSGNRATAGDGMPEQVDNYAKDGSRPQHRTVHHLGSLARKTQRSPDLADVTQDDLAEVVAYDATAFPAARHTFLARWLFAPGHHALLRRDAAGQVVGYAVARPAPHAHRIGPVVAEDLSTAQQLIEGLLADLPVGTELSAFVPDVRAEASGLFTELGLRPHFHVVRMSRGDLPPHRPERMLAIASLELG